MSQTSQMSETCQFLSNTENGDKEKRHLCKSITGYSDVFQSANQTKETFKKPKVVF